MNTEVGKQKGYSDGGSALQKLRLRTEKLSGFKPFLSLMRLQNSVSQKPLSKYPSTEPFYREVTAL